MTRRVAIIGTRGYPSYYGGFETAVRKLAPYLSDRGWEVTAYGRPAALEIDDPTRDERVIQQTTWGLETKSLSTLSYGFTAAIDAAVKKPDAAIVMNVANGFWLPFLRARGIPTLVNVDGMEWERAKWGTLAKKVFYSGARATKRYADLLVYDSHEIGRRWREEFGRSGLFIPYGGDVSETQPLEDGLEPGGYVLLVARFVPENTVGEFLEAAEKLAEKWPVVLVGSTGYGGELDDRAQKLSDANPNVKWFGHINDDGRLHSLWSNAGAYFHGHSVGGTNPALVQAMALGAPTVARETVYNREVLGDSAVFTDPTPASIVTAVTSVMENDEIRRRLAEEVRARAVEHYSWDSVCRGYEEGLEKLIASRGGSQRPSNG
ncbi:MULTISPECIES: glycosyltransferase [unclassified Pseudoclavibacter]|uniref:glycosyltransferase n=1 Tax=unclassified Pseudoclavibacter TaxID=2615177 RepID=UPI001BAC6EFE|nr:glycosyltransferase [Pseudoclavibacter sp. Marseille-Q4354]MBS3180075.1 glycosyltransferase [Pseudoclavibacter sp. Marseille-Q4354]